MHFSTLTSLVFFLVLSLIATFIVNAKFSTPTLKKS